MYFISFPVLEYRLCTMNFRTPLLSQKCFVIDKYFFIEFPLYTSRDLGASSANPTRESHYHMLRELSINIMDMDYDLKISY